MHGADQRSWHLVLPLICLSHNNTGSPSLGGYSPSELMLGRKTLSHYIPLIPPEETFEGADVKEYQASLARAREYQHALISTLTKQNQTERRERHNLNAKHIQYKIGDFVFAKNLKAKEGGTAKLSN